VGGTSYLIARTVLKVWLASQALTQRSGDLERRRRSKV
jgi:hypothetical protein